VRWAELRKLAAIIIDRLTDYLISHSEAKQLSLVLNFNEIANER
jgi:hypothetical protein